MKKMTTHSPLKLELLENVTQNTTHYELRASDIVRHESVRLGTLRFSAFRFGNEKTNRISAFSV